jgi:hypothetical protein
LRTWESEVGRVVKSLDFEESEVERVEICESLRVQKSGFGRFVKSLDFKDKESEVERVEV